MAGPDIRLLTYTNFITIFGAVNPPDEGVHLWITQRIKVILHFLSTVFRVATGVTNGVE